MKLPAYILCFIVLFTACQQEIDEDLPPVVVNTLTPIHVDSSFVPPVKYIKYSNNGAYFFEFVVDTGFYYFSADTSNNQFKIIVRLHKKRNFNNAIDSVRFTYRYDTSYRLTEIERNNYSGDPIPVIKLFYSLQRLVRFEEWAGNTLYKTYNVSHNVTAGGRKMTISPYAINLGSDTDSLTHSLVFDAQDKVTDIFERRRRLGSTNTLGEEKMSITYTNDDVVQKQGSQVYTTYPPASPRVDSLWTTYSFVRTPSEAPVLAKYFKKLYGTDFYSILNYCSYLFFQNTPAGGINLLVLPYHDKTSYSVYQYSAVVYTNGVQSHIQSGSQTKVNSFDSQNRLIQSRVNSTPPHYYIWEVVYP